MVCDFGLPLFTHTCRAKKLNHLFVFIAVRPVVLSSSVTTTLGLLSLWGWDQRLQSPARSHHTDHRHLRANAMLQRGKPRAPEDSVCAGCIQAAEEARPVPSCQHLRPSLLVGSQHWQKWWRGVLACFSQTLTCTQCCLKCSLAHPHWLYFCAFKTVCTSLNVTCSCCAHRSVMVSGWWSV